MWETGLRAPSFTCPSIHSSTSLFIHRFMQNAVFSYQKVQKPLVGGLVR